MTEAEVIAEMRNHLESKFPKPCRVCGRVYTNLRDYLRHTTHVGQPFSYDEGVEVFHAAKPMGAASLANCSCGNTLSIDSDGMSLITLWRLMCWLRSEMTRRRQNASGVLEDLRRAVDQATLAESQPSEARER